MTIRRFLSVLFVAVLAEAGVFAWYYDDLLYLRAPAGVIASGERETFERKATSALTRQRLTRHHIETLAEAAKAYELHELEVQALERGATDNPDDRGLQMRLADALRRSGELKRAEAIYIDLLRSEALGSPE